MLKSQGIQKFKRYISGFLAGVMTTSLVSMLPAKADETELYPYAVFTNSNKDGSISINAKLGGCINGDIATNGTINSSENINFNGREHENLNIKTINISQKLTDKYFKEENVFKFDGCYEVTETNVNLNNPLSIQGEINLQGNVNFNSQIFSLADISLNGEVLNGDNSVIYSQLGDVNIDFSNVNFSGLIYAPNGDVEISGQWLNLNNVIIIADTVTIDGQYINMNYSRNFAEIVGLKSEKTDDIEEENSSIAESSQIEESSSVVESSQNKENSSIAESSQTEENSSIAESSQIEENSSIAESSQIEESSSIAESSQIEENSSIAESSQIEESSSIAESSSKDDSSSENTDLLDDDEDGLVNSYEELMGTDKYNPDTDNDGLTDFQEIVITNTDPLVFDSVTKGISDADADCDNDGLSNIKEIELGTEPQNADTDLDGLSDGDEVNIYGTDPLNPDTDGDGICDGDEVTLGLDPKSATSDGKNPDNERTFSQHLGINTENFSEINTDDNPFNVSMDIVASGNAESNLNAFESGYTNIINSDMVLGVVPEFTYASGLDVEQVTINFDIKENIPIDSSVNVDLQGLKRYSIFKYFEDIDMLLPIETSYDEANNRIYTNVDELGIYCIMDMQQWFKQMGVDISNTTQSRTNLRMHKQNRQAVSPTIDIVFNIVASESTYKDIALQVVKTCEKLFEEYGEGDNIHIFVLDSGGNIIKPRNSNQDYATNIEEINDVAERIRKSFFTEKPKICLLTSRFLNKKPLRENADKYYISVQSAEVSISELNLFTTRLQKENITACVVANLPDTKSLADATGGIFSKKILSFSEPISDFIISFHKMKGEGKVYKTISAAGWKVIALEADITSDYKEIADRGATDEERLNYADQDNDGLLDLEELRYAYDNNQIINWDNDGNVILPTIQDCINFFSDRPYMTNPLAQYGSINLSAFDGWKILPIKSDPTSDDSDGDGLKDKKEKQIGTKLLNSDTDNDGLDDYKEIENWFDPLDPNPDGDTYSDLQEYQNGTSPYVYDLSLSEWKKGFLKGFVCGDAAKEENFPTLLGQITGGMTLQTIADVRDITINIIYGQWGSVAINALGLVPIGGDVSKTVNLLSRFITKNADNVAEITKAIIKLSEQVPDVLKYLPQNQLDDFEKSLKNINKISKSDYEKLLSSFDAIGKNVDDYLDVSKYINNAGGNGGGGNNGGNNGNNNGEDDDIEKQITRIAKKYKLLECVECADEIQQYLLSNGLHGKRIELQAVTNEGQKYYGIISLYSNQEAIISQNGHHSAIMFGNLVYDNINPNGIEYEK